MTQLVKRPDLAAIRSELKNFQLRSVDYIVRRLYDDPDRVDRFLLADEVGLGKTKVARAVIAHAIERLWDHVKRIDVVYVCSNATIARQNVARLQLNPEEEFTTASRLTLLPLHSKSLAEAKLNFVSFTPATSLDLGSSTGVKLERILLHHLLEDAWSLSGAAPLNVLQGDVNPEKWRADVQAFGRQLSSGEETIDHTLHDAFVAAVRADPTLRADFDALVPDFGRVRTRTRPPDDVRQRRNRFVGRLRRVLARTCIHALQPDVVVLDEFQRFKTLLAGAEAPEEDRDAAELASELLHYRDGPEGPRAKVLLLSATPYKMYTLAGEEENHYQDFLSTTRFLFDSEREAKALDVLLYRYRDALCGDSALSEGASLKASIEEKLRRVMCRTERLAVDPDRNGMVQEHSARAGEIKREDVRGYRAIQEVARALGAGDCVELWKSAPYLLNLMDEHYVLKSELRDGVIAQAPALVRALRQAGAALLDETSIETYGELDAGNARMRALLDATVRNGGWKLLWVPPSLPYYLPRGAYAEPGVASFTKALVFSSWHVVPKAIAMLASYEAERLVVRSSGIDVSYQDLRQKLTAPLRFAAADGRLTGMPVFALVYPCATLALRVDPLDERVRAGGPLGVDVVLTRARAVIAELLTPVLEAAELRPGPVDERWYWAALLLLDQRYATGATKWVDQGGAELAWQTVASDADEESHFERHVAAARDFLAKPVELGPPPADLVDVLAKVAVGSPAVTLLRALRRQWPDVGVSPALLASAARGAMGFRSLYNRPETVALIRGMSRAEPYWERALEYGIDGNLQAVMDEYTHALRDHLGLRGNPEVDALAVGEQVEATASLSAVRAEYDVFHVPEHAPVSIERRYARCRYALRFGQGRDRSADAESGDTRDDEVRDAFNSPFRPFILASTSVGQEGLDFHLYCHAIYHWNLPSNPVDLEQREGRIHRFKGHVVRRNVAAGAAVPANDGADPRLDLFDAAAACRVEESELVPYWVCRGGHRIERNVPLLALSREEGQFAALKKSMALYRLVFGQPRQEDLLRVISARNDDGAVNELRIDLSPK